MLIPVLIVLNTIPHFKSSKISIEASANPDTHWLASESTKGFKTKREVSDLILQNLIDPLWKDAGEFKKWPNDPDCTERERFLVSFGKDRRQICASKIQIKALHEFRARANQLLID